MDKDVITSLKAYSACDIADALLKLKVTGAGFIQDLVPYTPTASPGTTATDIATPIIAPISTVLFVSKDAANSSTVSEPPPQGGSSIPPSNIPKSTHWSDLTQPNTVVLLRQPPGQSNAVCGGIMARRMHHLGAHGAVVVGRIRDIPELRDSGLPVWARGTSVVGAGGGSVAWAVQVPVDVDGVLVEPGDLAVLDPVSGVVVVPKSKIAEVLELLPRLVAADEKVKEDVMRGVSVFEAFKRHRGNL